MAEHNERGLHGHHRHHQQEQQQNEGYPGGNPGPYGAGQYPPQPPPYGYQGGYPPQGYAQPGNQGYPPPNQGYAQPGYGYPPPANQGYGYAQPPAPYGSGGSSYYPQEGRPSEPLVDYAAQEHKHKKHEHLGEAGALAAGAFALYEAHEVKVDPENAGRHRIEESIAGVTAVGAGGYALYEHQQVRNNHKLQESSTYREEGQFGAPYPDYAAQEHKHKKNEHMGELGALASGAFAMYEGHQAKVDPEHAGRHRIEEGLAGVGAVGAGGYAWHEHHEARQDHKHEKHEKHEEKHKHHH